MSPRRAVAAVCAALVTAAVAAVVVGEGPSHAADTSPPIALYARINKRFVTADHAGADPLLASRAAAGSWESFDVVSANAAGWVALRSRANGKYVTVSAADRLQASKDTISGREQFQIQARPDWGVSLFARATGRYVSAEDAGNSPLVANRTTAGPWEVFDATTEGGQPAAGVPWLQVTARIQALADDGQVDVQPLGDSWTGGGGGCVDALSDNWRQAAAPRLIAAVPGALYVGSAQRGCSGDTWNSGWGGRKLADGLANDTWRTWLTGLHPTCAVPDVVVLELGINDFWHDGCTAADCLDRVDELVGDLVRYDPRIRVIVCDVPNIALPADRRAEIAAYNAALPARLDHYGDVRVGIARLSTHWDPANTSDGGFHPNVAGYAQVADAIMDSAAWPLWFGTTP